MTLSRCWHPLVQYIEERFQQFLQAETRINRLGIPHCDNDDDNDNDNYNDDDDGDDQFLLLESSFTWYLAISYL